MRIACAATCERRRRRDDGRRRAYTEAAAKGSLSLSLSPCFEHRHVSAGARTKGAVGRRCAPARETHTRHRNQEGACVAPLSSDASPLRRGGGAEELERRSEPRVGECEGAEVQDGAASLRATCVCSSSFFRIILSQKRPVCRPTARFHTRAWRRSLVR